MIMDKIVLWFFLSCKRQLKKPFFLILLLILPAGVWMFHKAEEESSGKISIALYMDGDELGLLEQWRGKQAGMLLKEEGTGFRILYGGTRAYGTFAYGTPYMNKDMNAYFWSSSKIVQSDSVQTGIIRAASKVYEGILRGTSNLTAAYSVRCIKE